MAPSANLAALRVVPVAGLLNSEVPSDTTYLDGVRDPNTVLTRLRTAAATPGPLLVSYWTRLKDPDTAAGAGLELLHLLRSLPDPDPGHLRLVQQRMELLNRSPSRFRRGS